MKQETGGTPLPAQRSSSGARAALAGFDYQLDVSILAALDLLLIRKSASQIILEPENDEDIEAVLDSERTDTTETHSRMPGYSLIVQVKRRTGEPWSVADFQALLKHGKARKAAREQLENPLNRYLLVTTAAVRGALLNLRVEDFEEWPEQGRMSQDLRQNLPNGADGRVAIWAGATDYVIGQKIQTLLGFLHVPHDRLPECRARLRQEAGRRMRGLGPCAWSRDDIEVLIRSCGGFLASSARLEHYVRPANWGELYAKLQSANALLIKGPSGAGKTLAALALCEEARKDQPHLAIVSLSDNPAQLRPQQSGPTLFYVDDPWGQSRLKQGHEPWTVQLPRIFREARPDCRYIVTSRTDMLALGKAEDELEHWSVTLDAASYEDGQLAKIYDRRIDFLPAQLQARGLSFRSHVLKNLTTPLEIDRFFGELSKGPEPNENDGALLHRAIALAHREAIQGVVVQDLVQDTIGWAAVLWALLRARSKVDHSTLTIVQRKMRQHDERYSAGLTPLANFLVAARHLRQPQDSISFSHPSVRDGFETFLQNDPARSAATIEALIDGLTRIQGDRKDWAIETAAQVARLGLEEFSGHFECPPSAQAILDQWLTAGLLDRASQFSELLSLASTVASADCQPGNLARWFTTGFQVGGQVFNDEWASPSFDEKWKAAVRDNPYSHAICARFVRTVLAQTNDNYGADFATRISELGGNLTDAFLDAAMQVASGGYYHNASTIAAASLVDLPRHEKVLAAAFGTLRVGPEQRAELDALSERIQNGELDAAAEDWYSDPGDGHLGPEEMVTAYVDTIRADGDWEALSHHALLKDLLPYWCDAIHASPGSASVDEVEAVIQRGTHLGWEARAWRLAATRWDNRFLRQLTERILAQDDDAEVRSALGFCLANAASESISEVLSFPSLTAQQRVAITFDLWSVAKDSTIADHVKAQLPFAEQEIFGLLKREGELWEPATGAALTLLSDTIPSASPALLNQIARIELASGEPPDIALKRALELSITPVDAVDAVSLAVHAEKWDLVRFALDQRVADARQLALETLGARESTPFGPSLLALVDDKGSRVRRALVGLLSERQHPRHYDVLLKLCRDSWSNTEPFHDEPPSYPIAREAIDAIGSYDQLDDDTCTQLIDIGSTSTDRLLRVRAFTVVANKGTAGARRALWAVSESRPFDWRNVDAIDALAGSPFVEPDIVSSVGLADLLRQPAPIAASKSVLVAAHADIEVAGATFDKIAHSDSSLPLLLLGCVLLARRDRFLANRLLDLLPEGHVARGILDISHQNLLPSGCIDDLGHILVRQEVLHWLGRGITTENRKTRRSSVARRRFAAWWEGGSGAVV
ncbi:hypothetical protein [Mesorhizobium sp. M0130]|uniref:nSTAND3 domain-containing NTPase n=1 Tax=Mesorhizobium sp. M0130 TaxID=2956887 RepID=UPI00333AFEBB